MNDESYIEVGIITWTERITSETIARRIFRFRDFVFNEANTNLLVPPARTLHYDCYWLVLE